MQKYLKIGFFLSGLLLFFFFQNCAKRVPGARDSASLAGNVQIMPKELIVKMKTADANNQLAAWAVSNGLVNKNASGTSEAAAWADNNMSYWGWDADKTPEEIQQILGATALAASVEYSEPNYVYQEASFQHLPDIAQNLRVLTQAINYAQESDNLKANLLPLQQNTPRPVVAVIDSGIELTHQIFMNTDAIWVNTHEIPNNQIDDDNNGYVDDVYGYNFKDKNNNLTDNTGHGTHCAGIVLGQSMNIFDMSLNAGLDATQRSKIKIMPLKFIGPNGGATSDAINAIFYAVNNGAQVLSNSWGGPSYSKALEDAIAYAYEREVVFVAASGNSASNNDSTPTFPANYKVPNVISVAASDNDDKLAAFSNYGATSVDIAAPGVSIKSTYPNPTGDLGSYDGYNNLSGTSMATPMVSGVVALALYENKYLSAYQLKNIIVDQSDSDSFMSGILKKPARLNPSKAVLFARTATPTSTKPAFARASSAAAEAQPKMGGCGLVVPLGNQNPPGGPPPFAVLALLMLPIALAVRFRFRYSN